MWHVPWQKLHGHQLTRDEYYATLAFWWGQRPFSNKIFCRDVFQFFFVGTKIKTDLNYRDENHI